MSDFDRWYEQYKADEDRRLNGHFPWTLARRAAFSRWRRAVLHLSFGIGFLARRRWLPYAWHDRMLDALYPDDCVITFK
jgi:hypothetical protein